MPPVVIELICPPRLHAKSSRSRTLCMEGSDLINIRRAARPAVEDIIFQHPKSKLSTHATDQNVVQR